MLWPRISIYKNVIEILMSSIVYQHVPDTGFGYTKAQLMKEKVDQLNFMKTDNIDMWKVLMELKDNLYDRNYLNTKFGKGL